MQTNPANARKLLKDGKAKVVKRTPFTIQLIYSSNLLSLSYLYLKLTSKPALLIFKRLIIQAYRAQNIKMGTERLLIVREYYWIETDINANIARVSWGDKILNVHHIESRQTGKNRPDNLITL